ncbi:cysteine desulfurase family protein [Tianweitania sediminis]|uniref:Cysteine desulfurase n=1 Tax=Tianweitania sediminis TaxID=1502156 RepID=A0A8J7ULE7_9HYPH|nr:cysteine desulfurase family protein [Tianweitania sediminis]MBP0440865.1 cysteine desulfurase [Tianweitania sediminis]
MTAPRVYLDHNASMPLRPEAHAAMLQALALTANPSSVHAEGRQARKLVEAARRDVALLVGADSARVVFTSGATEAAATLLTPFWTMGRAPLRFSRLYVGATEHPCVLQGGRFAAEDISVLPVRPDGRLDLDALASAMAGHDKEAGLPLVSVQAANNETGVLQPLDELAAATHAAGGILVVDAVQAAGRVALDLTEAAADYLFLSGHKIGGPKGIGAIVSTSDVMMPAPLIRGGGQERGHRGGTENLPGMVGFGAAARAARGELDRAGALRERRDRLEARIADIVPDAAIHSQTADRLPNTIFFTVPGFKAETAQIAFDLSGVALSAGSACSSGKVGRSHVLDAMGWTGEGALRVSFGHQTSDEELQRFCEVLRDIVARRDSRRAA